MKTNSSSSNGEKYVFFFFDVGHCFCCVNKQFIKMKQPQVLIRGNRVHVISCEANKAFIVSNEGK